jgi:hypothetical protein
MFFLGDGLFLGMGWVLFFLRAGDACRCASVGALLVFFFLLGGGDGVFSFVFVSYESLPDVSLASFISGFMISFLRDGPPGPTSW